MSEVSIYMSLAQQKKALNNQTFQISATDLQKEGNIMVVLASKADASRLRRNVQNNKGFRFSAGKFSFIRDEQTGGALSSKEFFKRAGRTLKPTARTSGHRLVNATSDYLDKNTRITDNQLRNLTNAGNNLIDSRRVNSKQFLETLTEDPIFNKKRRQAPAPMEEDLPYLAQASYDDDIPMAVAEAVGDGLRRGKLVKGSQEARDYMASIRARKSGGELKWKDGKLRGNLEGLSGLQKTPKKFVQLMKSWVQPNVVKSLATGNVPGAVGDALGNVFKAVQGSGVTGGGNDTLLNRVIPDLLMNKGLVRSHAKRGGSFRVTNGGSFMPY